MDLKLRSPRRRPEGWSALASQYQQHRFRQVGLDLLDHLTRLRPYGEPPPIWSSDRGIIDFASYSLFIVKEADSRAVTVPPNAASGPVPTNGIPADTSSASVPNSQNFTPSEPKLNGLVARDRDSCLVQDAQKVGSRGWPPPGRTGSKGTGRGFRDPAMAHIRTRPQGPKIVWS